jgi:hypothetical protein
VAGCKIAAAVLARANAGETSVVAGQLHVVIRGRHSHRELVGFAGDGQRDGQSAAIGTYFVDLTGFAERRDSATLIGIGPLAGSPASQPFVAAIK